MAPLLSSSSSSSSSSLSPAEVDYHGFELVCDAWIALAYFSIPAQILYFLRFYPQQLPFKWKGVGLLFVSFIVLCGWTHLLHLLPLILSPQSRHVSALALVVVKFTCALVSIVTSLVLLYVIPKAFQLPTYTAELEKEVEKRVAQLRVAQQDAEAANIQKGEFMAFLCHEIRNPCQAITANTDFLLETRLDPSQYDFVKSINSAADLMINIVNDVLDISRLESGRLALERIPVDVHWLLKMVIDTNRPLAKLKNLTLVSHIAEDVPAWIVGDPTRLHQIAINLITNAIKFTSHGAVSMTVRRVPAVAATRVNSHSPASSTVTSGNPSSSSSSNSSTCTDHSHYHHHVIDVTHEDFINNRNHHHHHHHFSSDGVAPDDGCEPSCASTNTSTCTSTNTSTNTFMSSVHRLFHGPHTASPCRPSSARTLANDPDGSNSISGPGPRPRPRPRLGLGLPSMHMPGAKEEGAEGAAVFTITTPSTETSTPMDGMNWQLLDRHADADIDTSASAFDAADRSSSSTTRVHTEGDTDDENHYGANTPRWDLELEVRDTGDGIADPSKLFTPYSQAKLSTTRLHGGTGLGLAICRYIVEMMGGTITCHSIVGQGSTFTVRFPLEACDAPDPDRDPRLASPGTVPAIAAALRYGDGVGNGDGSPSPSTSTSTSTSRRIQPIAATTSASQTHIPSPNYSNRHMEYDDDDEEEEEDQPQTHVHPSSISTETHAPLELKSLAPTPITSFSPTLPCTSRDRDHALISSSSSASVSASALPSASICPCTSTSTSASASAPCSPAPSSTSFRHLHWNKTNALLHRLTAAAAALPNQQLETTHHMNGAKAKAKAPSHEPSSDAAPVLPPVAGADATADEDVMGTSTSTVSSDVDVLSLPPLEWSRLSCTPAPLGRSIRSTSTPVTSTSSSTPNSTCTATRRLPVVSETADNINERDRPCVLVVDDNMVNRKLLHFMVSSFGFDVETAEDGQHAVERVRERQRVSGDVAHPYVCILMDISMPICDGFEASRLIRALPCATPIIAITANSMTDERQKATECGIQTILHKPVRHYHLKACMQQYVVVPEPSAAPASATTTATAGSATGSAASRTLRRNRRQW